MPRSASIVSPLNAITAAIAVLASLLVPPGVYSIVAHSTLVASMQSQAELDAAAINFEIIGKAPLLWQFQQVRLSEMMSHRIPEEVLAKEFLRVVDSNEKVVAAVGNPPPWPVVARSLPLFDAGRPVGRLEIQRSLRPLIFDAAWLSLFGLVLAAGSFVTLRVIPLRAVLSANETLRQRDASLAFANTLLTATTEGSLDAILVVDQRGQIVSYNRHFIELWKLPRALVEAHNDEPVLAAVTSQMRDTASFLARVEYLYHHPNETSSDRLELKDGRIVDRYTETLYGQDREYLGRVWFFRDVTERERAAEALKQSEARFKAIFDNARDGIVLVEAESKKLATGNDYFCGMLGYSLDELSKIALADIHPAEVLPDIMTEFEQRARGATGTLVDIPVKRKDGSIFFADINSAPVMIGGKHYVLGLFRDITERKLAAEKLQQRDALLHAAASGATELVTAPSLDEAIPKVLETVCRTIRVDRMTVIERPSSPGSPFILRYAWEAPDIETKLHAAFFEKPEYVTPQISAWRAPLSEGKIVVADARTATGDVRKRLGLLGIQSILLLPVFVDGKYWGQIGIDSCKQERTWPDFEIEILKSLADLIGSAIRREHYVSEIANANRIVQNTPTILYRMRGEPSLPIIYISQNIKLFGHEPAALIASPHLYQSLIHPDDIARVRSAMAEILENGGQRGVNEFRLLTSHGDYRWVENRYTPIRDSTGRLAEIEGLLFDITERKAAEEKIAQLARTDALTGLANRTTFIERLQQAFAAARRGSPPFAVFYLDLDHFKDINDTLGHPIGDTVLAVIGECLKASVRETDLVARFGGDEFAILQVDLGDSSDAGSLAVKIRAALVKPIQLGGNVFRMTASIGISTYAPDIAKPEDMLAQADVALYRAKEEGRDQYRFHSEALDIQVRERVTIAEELRMAVERAEFELYYQPQVELSTGQIVGMEALVRWNHPTRGLILPSGFIAVAEKTGNIVAIGRWVLDQACRQMSLWRKDGIAPPTLAVNISLAQVSAADEFIQFVTETLSRWGLAPVDLEFDVTESMLARATLSQNDALERLHKLGIKIAIDDFGAKFSTFDYLKTYRVNRLKIPQQLIAAAAKDPESAAMVRAIVGIARELNIEVIAQGVETEAHWTYLTATSPVTKVQGFFYSEPVPVKRAAELLRRGRISPAEGRRDRVAAKPSQR